VSACRTVTERTTHRVWLAALIVLALAWASPALHAAQRPGAPTSGARVTAVGPIGLTVSDMERSIAFYRDVLRFEKTSDVEVSGLEFERLQGVFGALARVVEMRLGTEALLLTQYLAPPGRPRPADEKSYDLWFQHVAIIVSDMDRAYQVLRDARVQLVTPGPQRLPDWNPNAGGIRAMYFRDPDGHPLEILWFPQGKGAARWHQASDRLFLGIDHTAIAVSNTEASLAFYRDLLGFEVAGHGENYGIEQERLNSVFGARLRITSVHAAAGPSIEFLEYLAPAGGRTMPADERANDLIHWQTRLVTRDAQVIASATREAGRTWVSPGVVRFSDDALGFKNGVHVRDPDGHVMEVIER